MIKPYDHKKIEKKWQKVWERKGIYEAEDFSKKPKFYSLIEFPFPSGEGMHTGHLRSNTAMDIISRKRRMEGFNVLYPIGWDAFGLPTENYAIKTGQQPAVVTKKNTDNFRKQLKSAGFSFDWSREVNTTDPKYYKWTQWIFLQFYKHNLAYKKKMLINWCPKDKIGLANEEVIDGKCERCGTAVEKREKEQWMLAITKYADRLDKDLDTVDYLEKIKIQQRNWIGKSEGAEIEFKIKQENPVTFYQFQGSGKIHADEPYVERDAIMALVKHWSEDKYLGLRWKKVDWETLITGGVEKGQKPEEAARAEIEQETGYKNLKLLNYFGSADSRFYHGPKKQNRFGHFHMYVFELKDGERNLLTEEEKGNHEPVWLTKDELQKFSLPSSHRYLFDLYENQGNPRDFSVKVFTTRPDTLFGVTYLVLAPEHPLAAHFIHQSSNAVEVDEYIKAAKNKSQIDRTTDTKEKTGVELKGIKAINPATKEEVPVYIADYVLDTYGTGAIMAVPAHDERDYEFAKKYNLPVKEVIEPLFKKKDGEDGVRAGLPFQKRHAAVAVIKHWSEDKYLILKWKKTDWRGFVIGGIEDGEDPVDTALREIAEETGYTSAKFIRKLGGTIHAQFYHAVKNVNRWAHFQGMYFELTNDARKETKQEEKDIHDILWISKKEVDQFLGWVTDMRLMWRRFMFPDAFPGASALHESSRVDEDGLLTNSGKFNSMSIEEAKKAITESVGGKMVTTYKLRDWVFSRQRYWGEPIPIIHCEKCGIVPVPEKDLPVKLPPVKNYLPTDTGESPLAAITKWVNVKCPNCKSPAKRETDTMPNWAGSSWYFLRYIDPKNTKSFADLKKMQYWMQVDWYNGGMEHTTLHLLYSRFWNKFLFDIGIVPTSEPYLKRTSHGLILAPDGEKMSKSRGNVVNPDSIIEQYGADTLRLYEMFMGPFDQPVAWSMDGIVGPRRFLERVWKLQEKVVPKATFDPALESLIHKTIKKVSEDIESMSFNTGISSLMILLNSMEKKEQLAQSYYKHFLKLLAPFAPHVTEELWQGNVLKQKSSIHTEAWDKANEAKITAEAVTIAVQVNGKVRGELAVGAEESEEDIKQKALNLSPVMKWLEGKEIKKVIYIKGRIVNIVIG